MIIVFRSRDPEAIWILLATVVGVGLLLLTA